MKSVVIVGPTCTGKTSLAIKLGNDFNGEIVSCDSRQVYKYMDIGTGKTPLDTKAEFLKEKERWFFGGISIYGYDLVSPDQEFSVYDFVNKATVHIKQIEAKNKLPFLVGGTGFYVDVLIGRSKVAGFSPNLQIRKDLEKLNANELFLRLQKLAPQRAKTVDCKNPIRLIRAIEIALLEKEGVNKKKIELPKISPIIIGLTSSRATLYKRADCWVDSVSKNGVVQETRQLLNMGFRNTRPLEGLIYNEIVNLLDGKATQEGAFQKIKFDMHDYIKRQLTWFTRNPEIIWYDTEDPLLYDKVKISVKSFLR